MAPSAPPLGYYLPHFAPLAVYFAVRAAGGLIPGTAGPYIAYILTVPAVAATLWFFRREYAELAWRGLDRATVNLALAAGAVGIALWILPYHLAPATMQRLSLSSLLARLGLGSAGSVDAVFDPHQLPPGLRELFLAARIAGAVVLIPFVEELAHRSAILRFVIDPRFRDVPVGKYTPSSFWIGLAFFAFTHEEWIVAAVWGALVTGLLYRTRRIEACVIAHAASNAILAAYVLARGAWHLW